MSDLISRSDAIEAVRKCKVQDIRFGNVTSNMMLVQKAEVIVALSALPSAETHEIRTETHGVCLISKDDAMGAVQDHFNANGFKGYDDGQKMMDRIKSLPSADAEQGWRIGKPTDQGEYMVTLDSFGHKHIDLFYYGKPLMPNRKVRGKCWYRSDDEWGDVVYDDTDILAWMPLPKPYKGGDDK